MYSDPIAYTATTKCISQYYYVDILCVHCHVHNITIVFIVPLCILLFPSLYVQTFYLISCSHIKSGYFCSYQLSLSSFTLYLCIIIIFLHLYFLSPSIQVFFNTISMHVHPSTLCCTFGYISPHIIMISELRLSPSFTLIFVFVRFVSSFL